MITTSPNFETPSSYFMSVALPYSFPKAPSAEPDSSLPREVQISQNLTLDKECVKVTPVQVSEPYVKTYSNTNTPEQIPIHIEDPLDDILADSHKEILEYSLDLPYLKVDARSAELPKAAQKGSGNQLLVRKRSRAILEHVSQRNLDNAANVSVYTGMNKTPTRTSMRILSLKKSKTNMRESSPTSDSKKTFQRNISFHKNDMKSSEPEETDLSISDPLACHAENIMRMAMDSTMFGSFCNNSFSSTFSNLADDSVVGKKYPDVLTESDKSMTESLQKPTSLLAKQRAQKIEISAEELREAVSESIR